jgi:hypothetical protein
MAKIVEDVVVIKFSKLVKDDTKESLTILNNEVESAIEQVAQELVGDGVVVEVERVKG